MTRVLWLASICLLPSAAVAVVDQYARPHFLTGSAFGIPGRNATYDYIVVGGGQAGSVVASRLTEHSNATVAIVEAGSFYELTNGNWSQIPYWSEQWVGAGAEDWQPLIDWGLFSTPQINNKSIHYAQGKNLGGSSGRNQMMYQRATKGSYDLWADVVGDDSYSWENMKKYLDRSIHFTPQRAGGNASMNSTPSYDLSAFSAAGGPVQVGYTGYEWPISAYAPAAFESLGMKAIPGFSSGHLDGYGYWQQTIDHRTGLRSSAENTFLAEAFGRPGLTAYINSMVRNIIIENGTATGVNVTNNAQRPFTLKANKAVIVSAGVWHSPQLLMVSGIGPKETLDKYNISVVADLPGVGQNIHDSCNIGGPSWEMPGIGFSSWQEPAMMDRAIQLLLRNHTGPLTNIGLDFGAWEKLPNASRSALSASTRADLAQWPADWPELEYEISASAHELLSSTDTGVQHGSFGILLVAATSRGNMTIQSASNEVPPIINPNWLDTQTDQEVAVEAYKRGRKAFEAAVVNRGREVFPGANVTTDTQLLQAIKGAISPIHHASSSCAMGRTNDTMAVVDSKARVFGVQNLRVIDSSSFPFTPPGHTMGVTYGHAEKLVQDILDEMEQAADC